MKTRGLMGHFNSLQDFALALKEFRSLGFNSIETFSSQEIDGLEHLLGTSERSPLLSLTGFVGAMTGLIGGFAMQWFANVMSSRLDIGGRPLNSWPAFIPVTFILTILCSALALLVTFFIRLRLPWPSHPVFKTSLDLSKNDFAILLHSNDPKFNAADVRSYFLKFKAHRVEELPWE